MAKTAAELIAHLEAGGMLASGDPERAQFVRFEMYDWHGSRQTHLGCYGWGSALGDVKDRLVDILERPYRWVCIPAGKGGECDAPAKPLLEALGKYEDYEWQLTVTDERTENVEMEPSRA